MQTERLYMNMKKESWLKALFDEIVEITYIMMILACLAFGWFWLVSNI